MGDGEDSALRGAIKLAHTVSHEDMMDASWSSNECESLLARIRSLPARCRNAVGWEQSVQETKDRIDTSGTITGHQARRLDKITAAVDKWGR